MNIADLWGQIENEQSWRQDEIRFLERILSTIPNEHQQDQFRRAVVLVLYAHFEGFCKFALLHYLQAVNSEGLLCSDANFALAAASLNDVFHDLRESDVKAPEFRNTLPDDSKLHRYAREREFLERSNEFWRRPLTIPDSVVETEDNLKPVVIRKLLYRLGLPIDGLSELDKSIHKLLQLRNSIGHGESASAVPADVYRDVREAAYDVMDKTRQYVMLALNDRKYLRETPTPVVKETPQ